MSETDDTDELLLIPPDAFVRNPDPDTLGPYFNVVDSLITQVSHLENRIHLIESSSELSISLISSPEMQSPSRGRNDGKRFVSSAQSTPQKPRTRFTAHSLPNSPDVDSLKKSPQKRLPLKSKQLEANPMLGEIDSFLSNVKLIKRLNAVRNLNSEFDDGSDKLEKLNLDRVNEMLKEVEIQDKKRDKVVEKPFVKERAWQPGDCVGSVPDCGFGIRNKMYGDAKQNYCIGDTSLDKSDSSSESTQTTAYDRFHCKTIMGGVNSNFADYDLGLVSLAKLWDSKDLGDAPKKFQQKLQEERVRRQHCEQAIQDLQNRILELQERVAVAIQVDEAKDKALLQFRESWEKTGSKLQDLEKQKEQLEEEVEKLRKRLNDDTEETNHKISYYEKEASLALNIAHAAQDKLAAIENRYEQSQQELKSAEASLEEVRKKYLEEVDKNKQYPEIIAQKELELNECKSVQAEARREVAQSKRAVEMCQSELLAMKTENDEVRAQLDVEKENNRKMVEQKKKLLEEIGAHKNVARGLQEELTKTREQMESNKIELKNFYQGQVELVVQNKLKEFQNQLDAAEKALKVELAKKEMSIAKTAASHIQQISEKHSLEIKLLEEKHQEECRLFQLQISQLKHQLDESNQQIKRHHDRQAHIEKQLHKFMESLKQDRSTTNDDISSFRSKSFNNLEEILSFNMPEDDSFGRMHSEETPLTSRNEKGAKRKEGTLQETIQMTRGMGRGMTKGSVKPRRKI